MNHEQIGKGLEYDRENNRTIDTEMEALTDLMTQYEPGSPQAEEARFAFDHESNVRKYYRYSGTDWVMVAALKIPTPKFRYKFIVFDETVPSYIGFKDWDAANAEAHIRIGRHIHYAKAAGAWR